MPTVPSSSADGHATQDALYQSADPAFLRSAYPSLDCGPQLLVLGGFSFLANDGPVRLSRSTRHLLAFLAVKGQRGGVTRDQLAGTLWPDVDERRAHARLRTELWRLRVVLPHVVEVGSVGISLDQSVSVDFKESERIAVTIIQSGKSVCDNNYATDRLIRMLASDLLPGWYEDWMIMEAERWRQQRLHALEALARQLNSQGQYAAALDAALAALTAEPLRESALMMVVIIHLTEGNKSEAIRACNDYRTRLWADLQLIPSDQLEDLVRSGIPFGG